MSGKRKQNREPAWLRKNRKRTKKPVRIQERLTIPGLGSITRAGRQVVLESNRTPAEHEALMQWLASEHPKVENEIQGHVDALARAIPQHDPLDLLHHAFTDFFSGMLGKDGEHEIEFSGAIDMRMLDYAHSVIVSQPPLVRMELDAACWKKRLLSRTCGRYQAQGGLQARDIRRLPPF